MKRIVDDLRLAARAHLRSPGFAVAAVLTLALGLGATTAVFSVVDAVLLRTLPYADPDRLVTLWGRDAPTGEGRFASSYPDFEDFRDEAESFEGLVATTAHPLNLTDGVGPPERLRGYGATHDLFELLGISLVTGSGFLPEHDRRGAEPVAILGEDLWKRRYGSDPQIVGRRIVLDDVTTTVVGVLANESRFPEDGEVWVPLEPVEGTDVRGVHNVSVFGRLAPGVDPARATDEVAGIAARLAREYPDENARRGAFVEPLRDSVLRGVETPLWILFAAATLVLLVACTNVAGLLLHRAAVRTREVATRRALGAGRFQLLRQFLAESALLVAAGAALGLGVGRLGIDVLVTLAPEGVPRLGTVALDFRILTLAAGLAGLTALLFGVMPLVESARTDLQSTLRQATGGAISVPRRRLRSALVVGEIALALVLVTGAALLLRSFERILAVDPGFARTDVLAMSLELPTPFIDPDYPRTVAFFEDLVERVGALPGVAKAAAAYNDPVNPGWETSFRIEGRPEPPPGEVPEANLRPVTPGYFETVGIPLRRGRFVDERDHLNSAGAVVINEAFARAHFPGEDPLGQRLRRSAWWDTNPEVSEIVGIVGDVRFAGLDVPPEPAMYFPHAHQPLHSMTLLVRPDGADPLALADEVRAVVWEMRPDLPVASTTTLGERLASRTATARFLLVLFVTFGGLALFLAALGIYGVLAYQVVQRRREIGLRMALGASAGSVVQRVVAQALLLLATGLGIGTVAALGGTRFLGGLLYDTSPFDPLALTGVIVVFGATALVAAVVPARRAARVDPIRALRAE